MANSKKNTQKKNYYDDSSDSESDDDTYPKRNDGETLLNYFKRIDLYTSDSESDSD